jgi:Flp pilus assembly protein TadG
MARLRSAIRERLREQRGASALEFALVLPMVVTILGMVLATGLRMVYVGLAEHEVRTLTRTAGIRTTSSSSSPYPDDTAAHRLTLCTQAAIDVPGTAYNPSTDCSIVKTPNVATPNEGDVVTATLTYRINAIQGLTGWLPTGVGNGLSVIKATASVTRE